MASAGAVTAETEGLSLSASARWREGRVFVVRTGGHQVVLDSHGGKGPAAMEGVLASLAACMGSMVAEILEVMREPFDSMEVSVRGVEASEPPRVLTSVDVEIQLTGADPAKAERAASLAESRYCPVSAMIRKAGAEVTVRVLPALAGLSQSRLRRC